MADNLVIKLDFEGTTKRMIVSNPLEFKFSTLEKKTRESFKISAAVPLTFKYTDGDGDVVTLSDDEDVQDAVSHQKLNPLRLAVTASGSKNTPKNEPAAAAGPSSPAPQEFVASLIGQLAQGLNGGPEPYVKAFRQFSQKVLDPSVVAKVEKFVEKAASEGKSFEQTFADAFKCSPSAEASSAKEQQAPGSSSTAAADKASDETASAAKAAPAEKEKAAHKEAAKEIPAAPAQAAEAVDNSSAPEVEGQRDTQFHPGVQCDVCGMLPIVGPRFKSLEKEDYDLCRACMADYSDKHEKFSRLERPVFRARHQPGYWGPCQFRPAMRGHGSFGGRPFHPARCSGGPFGMSTKLDARFVRDVTIYDGTEMAPGSTFTKIWRMRNSGGASWPHQTQLMHVGGDKLGSGEAVTLQVPEVGVQPEEEIDAAVDLVAPEKPGRYVSHWRLAAPNGAKFGHRVWCLIQVVAKDEESPQVAESVAASSDAPAAPVDTPATPTAVAPSAPVAEAVSEPVADPVSEPVVVVAAPPKPEEPVVPVQAAEPAEELRPSSPKEVNTTVGDFSLVEKSAPATPTAAGVEQGKPALFAGVVDAPAAKAVTPVEVPVTEQASKGKTPSTVEADAVQTGVKWGQEVAQLVSMGFNDVTLAKELLEKHEGNLAATIEALVAAAEWDPMLKELEEMGFYDVEMNRHLMVKNNGSLKRVVKDLVELTRAGTSQA